MVTCPHAFAVIANRKQKIFIEKADPMILQIELTNRCNRSCVYCGNPQMERPKGFMSRETISRCIEVLEETNQKQVGLNHYGESLMSPNFLWCVSEMNAAGIHPWVYTNGDFLVDSLCRDLCVFDIDITLSGHRQGWERDITKSICNYYDIRLRDQVPLTPNNTIDLAGQVKGYVAVPSYSVLHDPAKNCRFLTVPKSIVLWNGDLVPCCCDFEGYGVFGTIFDEPMKKPLPFSLCAQCPGHPGS
jgi:hypothetical protein